MFNKINTFILYSDNKYGAGGARNLGLKNARGKWLLFLDSDDFFLNTAFTVFDKYLNSSYDVIYFKLTSIFSATGEIADRQATALLGWSRLRVREHWMCLFCSLQIQVSPHKAPSRSLVLSRDICNNLLLPVGERGKTIQTRSPTEKINPYLYSASPYEE